MNGDADGADTRLAALRQWLQQQPGASRSRSIRCGRHRPMPAFAATFASTLAAASAAR